MRIRTIKPEFFVHEGLFEAESETSLPLRLAFIGLWCAADRDGRFKWEPRRLGVQIMPYDQIDFSRVLDALTTRGFVRRYTSDSRAFGCIPTFARHQVINNRERESELPEPPSLKDSDACPTRASRVDDAGKAEGKGREQGKEGKGTDAADASGVNGSDSKLRAKKEDHPHFEEFWDNYPRREGKPNALKSWNKEKPDIDDVLNALKWQKRKWTDPQYIPLPATYLNQRRFEDEVTVAPSKPKHPGIQL